MCHQEGYPCLQAPGAQCRRGPPRGGVLASRLVLRNEETGVFFPQLHPPLAEAEPGGQVSALNTGLSKLEKAAHPPTDGGGGRCGKLPCRGPPSCTLSLLPLCTPCKSNPLGLPPQGSRGGVGRGPGRLLSTPRPQVWLHLQDPLCLCERDPSPVESHVPSRTPKQGCMLGGVGACEPAHLFTRYFWLDTQETDNSACPGGGAGHLGSEVELALPCFLLIF